MAENPEVFTKWIDDGSLTDAVVEGNFWLPSREAFIIFATLYRLPLSIALVGLVFLQKIES